MSASNATVWGRLAVYSTLVERRHRMLCLRTSDLSVTLSTSPRWHYTLASPTITLHNHLHNHVQWPVTYWRTNRLTKHSVQALYILPQPRAAPTRCCLSAFIVNHNYVAGLYTYKKLSYCRDSTRYDKISDSGRSAITNRNFNACDFCPISCCISKTIQDMAIVTMEDEYGHVGDPLTMTFSDPYSRDFENGTNTEL